MTNIELIEKIQEYYTSARDSDYEDARINRGRKHSISSKTEDLIAYYLLKQLKNIEFNFLVDYPITYRSKTEKTKSGNFKSKTIYPDIAIVQNNKIIAVIDIKMDLGFNRNFDAFLKNVLNTVTDLQVIQNATYKKIDEWNNKTRESYPIQFSKDLKWHIVVVSDQNISQNKRIENEAFIESICSDSPLNYYVLTRESHPNGGMPIIQENEFTRLLNNL